MTVHDHTQPRWGHAASILGTNKDGTRRACIFQRPAPRPGDVILLQSSRCHDDGTPGVLQYRIVGDVETPFDPGDQHFLTLSFMERETNEAGGRRP